MIAALILATLTPHNFGFNTVLHLIFPYFNTLAVKSSRLHKRIGFILTTVTAYIKGTNSFANTKVTALPFNRWIQRASTGKKNPTHDLLPLEVKKGG